MEWISTRYILLRGSEPDQDIARHMLTSILLDKRGSLGANLSLSPCCERAGPDSRDEP